MIVAAGKMAAATHSPQASRAAIKVMEGGGNAVDGAVAASLMLGVVEPGWNGIGGGGFAVIYDGSRAYVLDYREASPKAANIDLFSSEVELAEGYKAIAVPGTLKGLWELHRRFGRASWERLLGMAAEAAREWRATSLWTRCMEAGLHNSGRKLQVSEEGREWLRGGARGQARLASLLKSVGEGGVEEFYEGWVSEKVEEVVERGGGILRREDLEAYTPIWREPVETRVELGGERFRILSAPPPCSGAVILEALKILWMAGADKCSWKEYAELLIRTLGHALRERRTKIWDPVRKPIDLDSMLSGKHMEEVVGSDGCRTSTSNDEGGTSHISVADGEGMWVSLTESIECFLGSGVVIEGVIMNDQMHDFDLDPNSPNSVKPSVKPASSMSPTIILAGNDEPVMAIGASGGYRIISSIIQVLAGIFFRGLGAAESVLMPRIHLNGSEALYEEGVQREFLEAAESLGLNHRRKHVLELYPGTDIYFGSVEIVHKVGGELTAVSDVRKQSGAAAK